jgi:hypothetical protein
MATQTLTLNQPYMNVGLANVPTYTVPTTVTSASPYNCHVELTELPPSGLVVVVNKNGSAAYTAPTIGQTQSSLQFKAPLSLTSGDVVTVVLSSSTANDLLLNSVKSTVTVGTGA